MRNLLSFLFAAMMAAGGTQAQDFSTPTENDVVPEGFVLNEEETDTVSKNSVLYKRIIFDLSYYGILSKSDTCNLPFKFKKYKSDKISKVFAYYYAYNHIVMKEYSDMYGIELKSVKSYFYDFNGNLVGNVDLKNQDGKVHTCIQKYFLKDGKKYATETKQTEDVLSGEYYVSVSLHFVFTNHIDGTEVSIVYKKGDVLLVEEKRKDGTKKSYRHLAKDKDIAKLLDDNVKFYKSKFPEADWEWLKQ